MAGSKTLQPTEAYETESERPGRSVEGARNTVCCERVLQQSYSSIPETKDEPSDSQSLRGRASHSLSRFLCRWREQAYIFNPAQMSGALVSFSNETMSFPP
jgi:hypothetical protein